MIDQPVLPNVDATVIPQQDEPGVNQTASTDLNQDLATDVTAGQEPSESLDLPLRTPFEAPSMDFDDLSNLEALIQKAPTTPTKDSSLNVAGAPLLDPGLIDEFGGVDPLQSQERDIPYEV